MRLQIRHQTAALLTLIGVLPVVAVSVASYFFAKNILIEKLNSELEMVGRGAFDRLEGLIASELSDIKIWARLDVMQDILIDDEENEISTELRKLRDEHRGFAALVVLNARGVVAAAADEKTEGLDLSRSTAFEKTRRGVVFKGRGNLPALFQTAPLVFAVPIVAEYDPRFIIGTLIGAVDWDMVNHTLENISMAGGQQSEDRVLVLRHGQDGKVLYSTREVLGVVDGIAFDGITSESGVNSIQIEGRPFLVTTTASRGLGEFDNFTWFVHAAVATNVASASINRFGNWILVISGSLCLTGIFVAWLAAKVMLRPLVNVVAAMRELTGGNLDMQILERHRQDEIGDMARSLEIFRGNAIEQNHVEKELEIALDERRRSIELQREFVANAAHELRTPLAVLKARFDSLELDSVKEFQHEIDHMARLVSQLLDFARFDAVPLEPQRNVNLVAVAQEVIAALAPVAIREGKTISLTSGETSISVRGNPDALVTALRNVVENAVVYSHGDVEIEVVGTPDRAIRVVDEGPGISAHERAFVFQRFWRGKDANRKPGTGLGLALAAQIIESHGGTVTVDDAPQGGALFTLKFAS